MHKNGDTRVRHYDTIQDDGSVVKVNTKKEESNERNAPEGDS
jgi:hypothetical protein